MLRLYSDGYSKLSNCSGEYVVDGIVACLSVDCTILATQILVPLRICYLATRAEMTTEKVQTEPERAGNSEFRVL